MDDTNEWHVVQRKKRDAKNTTNTKQSPPKMNSFVPPNKLNKNKIPIVKTKEDFIKNRHHIENNLTQFKNNDKPDVKPILDEYINEIVNNEKPYEMIGNGMDIMLTSEYVLWVHSTQNNDWSLAGYKKLCTIRNVSEFWQLFNNIHKLNFKNNNFFLMKQGVNPIWEDESNRDGGICSFRVEMDHALKVYELLCIFLMCNKLVANIDDINGISITPKNNWAILKIWNKDKNNKIDRLLHKSILDKYKNVSIQYKQNQPEY